MNSRRKFLLQGSLATTALLAAKPFKTLAQSGISIPGFNTGNAISVLHSSNSQLPANSLTNAARKIKSEKSLLVLHSGKKNENSQMKCDASIAHNNAVSAATDNYRILHKGNLKIGVISTEEAAGNISDHVNNLSAYLKNDKKCGMVVCLSQLGYNQKNQGDDVALAKSSKYVDMIIGGKTKGSLSLPHIMLNNEKKEVIISHVSPDSDLLAQINIVFDDNGNKRHISFN